MTQGIKFEVVLRLELVLVVFQNKQQLLCSDTCCFKYCSWCFFLRLI